MEREDIKDLVRKWWEIYEDETLDYKTSLKDHDEKKPGEKMLRTAMSEAGVVAISRPAPRAT